MKNPKLKKIPGDSHYLFPWGDTISLFKDYNAHRIKKFKKYGEAYKIKFLKREVAIFLNKNAINDLIVQKSKFLKSKPSWDLVLGELFPNGLMLMDDDTHKYHRSIIAEAFKKEPMEGYLDMMKTIIPNHINNWNDPNPKLFPVLKAFTLDIALKVFFGVDHSKKFTKINKAITDIVEASSVLPIKLPFTKYNKGLKARKYLIEFFTELLPEKRKNPKKDLFSMLVVAKNEDGESLTDVQIVDHLIFILMAAHDTTASSLTSFCYFLAKHKNWQNKLRKEAKAFYAEHGNDFSVRDLRKLEHMSLALKETLRRYPPIVTVGRAASKNLEFNGFDIPKDTQIYVSFDHNHHNPEIWSNPMAFDPERFSKERSEHLKCPYGYTPFGAGPHFCIGFNFAEMQIKYIISHLLVTHEWSVPENYEIPMNPVPLQMPKDGLPVTMKKI